MANPQPEPSMEEILASIRRIISEDDDESEDLAAKAAPARPTRAAMPVEDDAPAPVEAYEAPAQVEDDHDDGDALAALAELADELPASSEDDQANPHLSTEDVEMIKKNVATAVRETEEDLIDVEAANAAASAFSTLSRSVRVADVEGPGKTLEEIVTALLRPMVKDWLDANLPGLVEEKVEEEVQRIARRR